MVFEHSRHSFIDPRRPQSIGEAMRTIEVTDDEPFIMQPGDFALASTMESLSCRTICSGGWKDAPASRGWASRCIRRLPSSSQADRHGDDGIEQPGSDGCPLSGHADLRLRFEEVSSPVLVPYRTKIGNKYAGQVTRRRACLGGEPRWERIVACRDVSRNMPFT